MHIWLWTITKVLWKGGIDFIPKGCIVFRVIHRLSCMIGLLLLKFLSEFLLSYCWQLGESLYMSNTSYLFYLTIFWVFWIFHICLLLLWMRWPPCIVCGKINKFSWCMFMALCQSFHLFQCLVIKILVATRFNLYDWCKMDQCVNFWKIICYGKHPCGHKVWFVWWTYMHFVKFF